MYMNGQIIFDLDKNECYLRIGDDSGSAFAWGEHPKHNTHLLCAKHDPKYVEGSKPTWPMFKCENCGNVGHTYIDPHFIWTGGGVSTETANEMYKAGKIKPASTLEEKIAWLKDRKRKPTKEEEDESNRKHEAEMMGIALRFYSISGYNGDGSVSGRMYEGQYPYRNPHNFRLVEQARKEYEVAVKQLQEELRSKYDPQFVEEDYNNKSLTWPERKAVVDEVWNTPELIKMRGRVE